MFWISRVLGGTHVRIDCVGRSFGHVVANGGGGQLGDDCEESI